MQALPQTQTELIGWLREQYAALPSGHKARAVARMIAALDPATQVAHATEPDYAALFARYRQDLRLSVNELAAECGMSISQLRTRFIKRFGDAFFAAASQHRRGARPAERAPRPAKRRERQPFATEAGLATWQAHWARYRDTPALSIQQIAREIGVVPFVVRWRFRKLVGEEAYRAVSRTRHGTGKGTDKKNRTTVDVYQRWVDLNYPTLEELGALLGVTRERVRQILSRTPTYQADRAAAARKRREQRIPGLDQLWAIFRERPAEFAAACWARGIPSEQAKAAFRDLWPEEYWEAATNARQVITKQRRLKVLKDRPALERAWETYKANPEWRIVDIAQASGLKTMTAYRILDRALGDEFRAATSSRKGWGHSAHPLHRHQP